MVSTSGREKECSDRGDRRPFHGVVLTLLPDLFPGPLGASLLGKALSCGLWKLTVVSLRAYGVGVHQSVDAPCYGGGPGMVLRPDVVHRALQESTGSLQDPWFLSMTPRGRPLVQKDLDRWSQSYRDIVILCGRYEGIDERVVEHWGFEDISLGDFLLCGGEIPAMALIEGCVRLLPGVIGNPESLVTESFCRPLLEHPQYTRPQVWEGIPVPEVLLSGHHKRIKQWQWEQSCTYTRERRPDLWASYVASERGEEK